MFKLSLYLCMAIGLYWALADVPGQETGPNGNGKDYHELYRDPDAPLLRKPRKLMRKMGKAALAAGGLVVGYKLAKKGIKGLRKSYHGDYNRYPANGGAAGVGGCMDSSPRCRSMGAQCNNDGVADLCPNTCGAC